MFENLKKTIRAIRRDYFDSTGIGTMMGGVVGIASCVVGVIAIFVPGPPALLWIAGGLLAAVTGAGVSTLAGKSDARKREESWVKDAQGDSVHIVGPGLKVTTLFNTQRIVEKMTRDLALSPTLPKDVEKKLEPWLRDAEEAAKEVQGWDKSGNPVATISFLRSAFNAQGVKAATPVATYNLFNPLAVPPAAAATVAAPAPASAASGVIVVPKTITLKGPQTP